MTEQAARSWLSSHDENIPAIEVFHRLALETLEDHRKTIHDLADIVALDPGMSLSVFREVNGKLQQGGKHPVDSVHAALSLLGDSSIADLVMQHQVLDKDHPLADRRSAYNQLFSRCFHLLSQLQYFISLQGVRAIFELRSAALLHNIAEFAACLFDPGHYQQYLVKFDATGISANSSKPAFGFDFYDLGRLYAKKYCLPELVGESFRDDPSTGRKARLIQLADDISHQAESGWYHSSMKATAEVCAAYLNQSIDGFDRTLHQVAIQSAHDCPIKDVLPAASRLIMLPDTEQPAASLAPKAATVGVKPHTFEPRIKALLAEGRPTTAGLLTALLDHLHDDLHLSRISLMLLSKDRSKLGTRAGKGIDEHSPIRTLVVDARQPGLLRSMLGKPQSIWVQPTTYAKYEAALPGKFKSSFLHENFFLMSLYIAGKPAGLIFADRAQAVMPLDQSAYTGFKSAILLASKALTHLARGKAVNADS